MGRRRFSKLSALLLGSALLAGCGRQEPKPVSHVVLPAGLKKPANLHPDPASPEDSKPVALNSDAVRASASTVVVDSGKPIEPDAVRAASAIDSDGFGIEGVCRYDADSRFECWDLGGHLVKKLTQRVLNATPQRQDSLSFKMGRINRLLLLRLPRSTEQVHYAIDSTGTSSRDIGAMGVSTGNAELRQVAIDADYHTPSVDLVCVRKTKVGGEASIALKPGAAASLEGRRFVVTSIKKFTPDDAMMSIYLQGRPGWQILISPSGKPDRAFRAFPIDPYGGIMMNGARISLKKGRLVYAPKGAPRIQNLFSSEIPTGSFSALVDQDPARIKTLTFGAETEYRVRLTGIPLDPR